MIKIDLHTHSIGSVDGGITIKDYANVLQSKILNYIAVTDHDTIENALLLHQEFGDKIIVGQEVTTKDGELIGLFLSTAVPAGLGAIETATIIRQQNGLVYVPHPFENVRKGISIETLQSIADLVDMVEVCNGRAFFQNKGPEAYKWARRNNKAMIASSDAHGKKGIGSCFTTIKTAPTTKNLVNELKSGKMTTNRPPLLSLLYPKYNRIRGKIGLKHN